MSTLNLSNLILNFVKNTILGMESGMYKTAFDLTQNSLVKNIQINFLVNYFNSAYSALILNTDQYFVNVFKKMHEELNHSYICLLNITFSMSLQLIQCIDRNKLNVTSYDLYMTSINDAINENNLFQPLHVSQYLSHDCSGIDIKTCDPKEKLFHLEHIKYTK